jgi:hypothetical protein
MADQGTPPGALPERDWLEAELADSLDEDFEPDLEDAALSLKIARIYEDKHPDTIDRTTYSHVLIRLQSQLISKRRLCPIDFRGSFALRERRVSF